MPQIEVKIMKTWTIMQLPMPNYNYNQTRQNQVTILLACL